MQQLRLKTFLVLWKEWQNRANTRAKPLTFFIKVLPEIDHLLQSQIKLKDVKRR